MTCAQLPLDEEEEKKHVKPSEARFERRLRDRYRCKINGHSCCFTDSESVHVQLAENDIRQWAEMIVRDYPHAWNELTHWLLEWRLCNYPFSSRGYCNLDIPSPWLGYAELYNLPTTMPPSAWIESVRHSILAQYPVFRWRIVNSIIRKSWSRLSVRQGNQMGRWKATRSSHSPWNPTAHVDN